MTLSKIINVQYSGQAADLIGGNPTGPVQGFYINNDSNNQNWTFIVVGGDVFKFQNGTSPGAYATISSDNIVGGQEQTEWRLIPVTSPISAYKIATPSGDLIWRLTGGENYAPIQLIPCDYEGTDALWTYRPAY